MIRRFSIILAVLLLVAAGTAYGQTKTWGVDITDNGTDLLLSWYGHPTTTANGTINFNINGGQSADIKFFNNTASTITITNTASPTTTIAPIVLNPGASSDLIFFTCLPDEGTWVFSLDDGGPLTAASLTVNLACDNPIPSLTEYGIIVLLVLLIISTAVILRKRHVTA